MKVQALVPELAVQAFDVGVLDRLARVDWDDVAIQYYVLSGCGIPVNKAYLVHINSGYVRDEDIVPEELFVIQDITGVVRAKQASIPDTLAGMRAMLRVEVPEMTYDGMGISDGAMASERGLVRLLEKTRAIIAG
jgi:hypothetical protein